MGTSRLRSQKGMATVEFSVIASMALLMAFVIVDFGSLIQAQAVVTNITREAGSLASRDLKTGSDLMTLMEKSSSPLDFENHPTLYKMYVVKVNAGDANNPNPTCSNSQTAQDNGYYSEAGQLQNPGSTFTGAHVVSPVDEPNCGLPQSLYDLLVYNQDPTVQASPVSQFTVVKTYWVHQPMTPLEGVLKASGNSAMNFDYLNFYTGLIGPDNEYADSMLISSKAVF